MQKGHNFVPDFPAAASMFQASHIFPSAVRLLLLPPYIVPMSRAVPAKLCAL